MLKVLSNYVDQDKVMFQLHLLIKVKFLEDMSYCHAKLSQLEQAIEKISKAFTILEAYEAVYLAFITMLKT